MTRHWASWTSTRWHSEEETVSEWPAGEPPWTRDEALGAQERPAARRAPPPVAGERVLFRATAWGPAVPATVTWVQDMTEPLCPNGGTEHCPDVYLWRHPDPEVPRESWIHPRVRGELELRPDPWPRAGLELDGGGTAACRESRVRGAPGWLREGTAP
jgi:hypothetical protein